MAAPPVGLIGRLGSRTPADGGFWRPGGIGIGRGFMEAGKTSAMRKG